VRFQGPLDADLLERAIRAVAERHAVLRSQFELRGGSPVVRVRDGADLHLERIDARGSAAGFEACLAEEIGTPFDLARDPLLRARLVRLAEDDHVLLVSAHHIVADCWSLGMPFGVPGQPSRRWMAGVFFRELWAHYQALRSDGEASPGPVVWSFADAVARQSEWLAGDDAKEQLGYWRCALAGSRGPLVVPGDFERPAVWDFRGARPPVRIDRDLAGALRNLTRSHRSTLFATLLACFDATLQRVTGVDDVRIGTTTANRARWDAEDLVGFFSNNVVLRTDLGGDPPFADLLERSRQTVFDAWSNQDLPFEIVAAELEPTADASRHPLFQVRFLLHQPDGESFEREGLALSPIPTGREVAKYDLTLLLADDGEELSGWLEYATSLYAPATALRLCTLFLGFAREAAARPDQRLSEIWRRVESSGIGA
jgi:hypothetical protein